MKKQILTSLIIVGLAAVTAGAGTSAYFNDTETSHDNTFQTGSLDLQVNWMKKYNGEKVESSNYTDNPGPIFGLSDIKPGDHGKAKVGLRIYDNPGHLFMRIKEKADKENGINEPERQVGDTDSDGELDSKIKFRLWYDDGDGIKQEDEKTLFYGTGQEMIESNLGEGHFLAQEFWNSEASETNRHLGVEWWLPKHVGNEAQSDLLKYDFKFYTEQKRHNENPNNPWNSGDDKPEEPENPEEPEQPEEGNDTANYNASTNYTVTQGDKTYEVTAINGDQTVEEFYEYQLPEDQQTEENGAISEGNFNWGSKGTFNLQKEDGSVLMLYNGTDGLSLVAVHGKANSYSGNGGGSVSFTIQNLGDGNWDVKDDLYRKDNGELSGSNYDRWDVDSSPHKVNWTWGDGGTDGGAFNGLGNDFEFTIEPRFNEEAPLYNQYYQGDLETWEILSGDSENPERIELEMDEPITVSSN